MRLFEKEVATTEWWFDSPRLVGIVRGKESLSWQVPKTTRTEDVWWWRRRFREIAQEPLLGGKRDGDRPRNLSRISLKSLLSVAAPTSDLPPAERLRHPSPFPHGEGGRRREGPKKRPHVLRHRTPINPALLGMPLITINAG